MSGTFQGINTLQFTPDNKYAYWYSGEFTATTATTLQGEFETGSYYLIGEVRIAGMVDMGSPTTGSRLAVRVAYGNAEAGTISSNPQLVIANLHSDGADKDMPFSDTAKIIIPPFTNVQFFRDGNQTSLSQDGTISCVFKVKGTVEQFDLELKE